MTVRSYPKNFAKTLKQPAAFALALMLFAGAPLFGAHGASSSAQFPIGYSSRGGTFGFIALMEQEKLLEREGVRGDFVYIGGPQIGHALLSGDIQMAIIAAAIPLHAAAQGAQIRFIGGVTDREVQTLVTDPKISKPPELKGTRMAIDRLGDYTDFQARKVLQKFGLEAQKDVTLVQLGSQSARFAALRSGQVQSTFVAPPLSIMAHKLGFRILLELSDLGFPSTSASLVVLNSIAERRSGEVYGIIRAVSRR